MEHLFDWLLLGFTWTLPKCDSKKEKKMWPSLIIICHLILMWSWHDCKCMNVHIIYFYPYLLNWLSIGFFSDKGSRLQDHMALYIIRELWDTGYQTTICKHWHLWLIIFGQFLEGWYQGFYQYQPFCWNLIKIFRTYHKLGHFQGKRSLDKRRDFSVYVLIINAQERHHARGILKYANTTIQWNPWYNEKTIF